MTAYTEDDDHLQSCLEVRDTDRDKKVRILIVDDEKCISSTIAAALNAAGYAVEQVDTEEALAKQTVALLGDIHCLRPARPVALPITAGELTSKHDYPSLKQGIRNGSIRRIKK